MELVSKSPLAKGFGGREASFRVSEVLATLVVDEVMVSEPLFGHHS